METVDNKRERSALYPMYTAEECFEIIELIDKLGGKVYSNSSVAQALGMSEKTNSFRAKISTLRQYGLISGNQGTIRLTSIANDYLYPTRDEQKKDAKLQAFLGVPLYKKLVERYENQALPSADKLSNILLGKEFGLTKATKDSAVENFMKSLEQLELISNGVLVINSPENKVEITPDKDEIIQSCTKNEDSQLEKEFLDKYYNFEIPTLCGKAAVIKIPQGVTDKDLDFIQLYIENMLPVFLQNLRSEAH
ncbi:MAG: hypothetical protein ACI4E4_05170 [Acetatifactor sp.]